MAQSPAIGAQASRLARDHLLGSSLSSPRMPKLLYGTAWKGDRTADLVYAALRAGFRGVDTAAQPKHYDERAVGEGVRRAVGEGLVQREHLFIQTKFTAPAGQNHSMPYDADAPLADKVRQSVQSSLENFTLEGREPYLDSVVVHAPMDAMQDTMTVWTTLQSYVPHRVRSLGISNADLNIVRALWHDPNTTVKPAVVQNRFHMLSAFEVALRAFCRDNDVVFQTYWTITANKHLVRGAPVARLARLAGVDLVPAFYSLVLGLGSTTILDGTSSEAHMKDDLEGIEKVGLWAEGEGAAHWEPLLDGFKYNVGDA